MKKNNNHFTLMFIPGDNGKTITFRFPKLVVYALLLVLTILLSALVVLVVKSGEIAAKMQLLTLVRLENDKLTKENDELRQIAKKIHHFDKVSRYLYNLALPSSSDRIRKANDTATYVQAGANVSNLEGGEFAPAGNSIVTNEKLNSFPNIIPVDGWITRHFVHDSVKIQNESHLGIDFAAATGTPIKATAPGVVGKIEDDKYFGKIISLIHENGFVTRYGHCSQILVSKHDRISRGQTIALVGNTGRSSAPHLHYEVIKDGKNIDPTSLIIVHKD